MNIKRLFALLLSLAMIFSLAACKEEETPDKPEQTTTGDVSQQAEDVFVNKEETSLTSESSTEAKEDTPPEKTQQQEASTSSTSTTVKASSDPADLSKEQIVNIYKAAAAKSHAGTKSQHKIKIEQIQVNGKNYDGITGLMSKLLANNSDDKDGITGGHQNLVPADVTSARAYKSGNNTVIEMNMKDQISGPSESDKSGSVGHAITVVGDISSVTKQITDLGFPLDINEKETKIYYTDATVKVVINEDGKIINGTWQYTVEISLRNYSVMKNVHVDSTSILMTNTLTVGGGFAK